jgi:hypothetical protein
MVAPANVPGSVQLDALAAQYRGFAETCRREGVPLYERICHGVAEDRDLLVLAATSPPEQQRPTLLMAAVHFLLLTGAEHPLARHYPTVARYRVNDGTGAAAPAPARPDEDPFPPFADFCRSRRAPLTSLLRSRFTQTNEVGRCALLVPGLATLATRTSRPVSLIDLGAAAGLNLLFDHYRYRYGDDGEAGDPGAAAVIECEVRAGHLPALELPPVLHRAGIDQNPLDPADEDDGRWLLACLWPGQLVRFERLERALAIARALPQRPVVHRGDMVDDLATRVAEAPEGSDVCLFHSWVAAYLPEERQRALTEAIAEIGARRPLWWLFAEQADEVPGLPFPPPSPAGRRTATALVLTGIDGAHRESHRLADVHPHGRWIRWWGPADRLAPSDP